MYRKLKIVVIIILVLCSSIFLFFFLKHKESPKINSYRIFYHKIDSDILNQMISYDLNIVEASFFNIDDVSFLHENNSKVVGYLSLVEIGSWDNSLVERLNEDDYLYKSGEKLRDLSDVNFLGNLSSSHYRKVLFDILDERILSKGMDGVFLDTLDWIDYYHLEFDVYEDLVNGYRLFLKELREKYPDIYVVQNRSFRSFELFSYEYIDGFLWENFHSPYVNGVRKEIYNLEKFSRIAKLNNVQVYAISFENEKTNKTLADKLGWVFLFSEKKDRYSNWYIDVR